jgi:acetylornithine deacetylase
LIQPIEERVLSTIEERQDDMLGFLQALVQQPSTLGNELGAQQIVYRKLKSLGLSAEMWEPRLDQLTSHPAFAPVEWDYEGRPNVTAVHPSLGDGGRSLVLNGHIDVVSPDPLWGWTYDPWGAEIVGDRMYGRGAADMKGGIAMMILALEGIIAAGVGLNGDVFVETVLEEECCGNGALACRLKGYSSGADAAIIPEPSALGANLGDLGVMWFRVQLQGQSGHVATAHEGNNVIEMCYPLMQALRELEEEMNRQVSHPLYTEHPHPINLNIGTIQGGHWPSSVPVECSFVCRLSYEPGVAYKDVRGRVENCIKGAAQQHPVLKQSPPKIEYYGFRAEGSTIDKESELVQALGRAHKRLTGEEMQSSSGTGLTDMRYFNLYAKTPATCYGPRGDNIHNADEYVELSSILTGTKTLALFMLDWCGGSIL